KIHRFEESIPKFAEVAAQTQDLQLKLASQKYLAAVHSALGFNNKAIDSLSKYYTNYQGKIPQIIGVELKTTLAVCYNEIEQFDMAAKLFHEIKEIVENPDFEWK
ncbi:hypothetical protein RZS08_58870, partial [Arthrospira platensis SPKY1]|nr:hypothetical protein [Arthrospira platensis SPKY1]